jgi:hypothetical protein
LKKNILAMDGEDGNREGICHPCCRGSVWGGQRSGGRKTLAWNVNQDC